jgi:UDP-N-acetylmuramoyl-tripeptide--D-alanyl-D-alanine ligase
MINITYFKEDIMRSLSVEDIVEATGGKVIYGNSNTFIGVSTDSRTIREGELFIALKGNRFDGHQYLHEALQKGSGAIVHSHPDESFEGKTIIFVNDTLKALQEIARHLRIKKGIPVIGITGSNGKTTTKELVASILGTSYKVLKNEGNLNNNIGLPLSLMKIEDDDEVVVLEMGASASGEIKELCEIAVPNYGVITNISYAHIEGFKNLETVRKTKIELLDYIKIAIVNADDPFLMEGIRTSGFKGLLIRYGIKNNAEIRATDIKLAEKGSVFTLLTGENKSTEIHSMISGECNIYNVLAAASIGYLFNVDLLDIKKAIDSFSGVSMRLEIKERDGMTVISDVYNANPASMEQAIKELARIKKGRTIAVLGDMLELGSYEEEAHRKLGRLLSELSIDIFIAVGSRMVFAASEFKGTLFTVQDADEAGKLLRDIKVGNDTVLIKGSRVMRMERVLSDG